MRYYTPAQQRRKVSQLRKFRSPDWKRGAYAGILVWRPLLFDLLLAARYASDTVAGVACGGGKVGMEVPPGRNFRGSVCGVLVGGDNLVDLGNAAGGIRGVRAAGVARTTTPSSRNSAKLARGRKTEAASGQRIAACSGQRIAVRLGRRGRRLFYAAAVGGSRLCGPRNFRRLR